MPVLTRSWANFSLLWLYSYWNAWANLHRLGQPNTFLARCMASTTSLPLTSGTLVVLYKKYAAQEREMC